MSIFNLTKYECSPELFAEISKSLLLAGYSIRFNAVGDSMLPLIHDGDLVVVEAKSADHLKSGEVIYYEDDHGFCMLHRVIRKRTLEGRLELQLQADNNLQPDGWIAAEKVLGRLSKFARNDEWVWMDRFGSRIAAFLILAQLRLNLNQYSRFRSGRQYLRFLPGFCKFL